jgi:hypothetical protein
MNTFPKVVFGVLGLLNLAIATSPYWSLIPISPYVGGLSGFACGISFGMLFANLWSKK